VATESFTKTFKLNDKNGLKVLSKVMSSQPSEIKRVDIQKKMKRSEKLLKQYISSKNSKKN